MSIKARTRYAVNFVTFTVDGVRETARWTYERDEDDVYPIPVGVKVTAPGSQYYCALWGAINAAAETTPPVRV